MPYGAATLDRAGESRRGFRMGIPAIVAVVLASIAGLIGLVGPEARHLTDLATRPTAELSFGQITTIAAGVIGMAAGLCLVRRWPWLLFAGALAGLPAAVVRIWPTLLYETTWPGHYEGGQVGIIDTLSASGTMGGSLLIAGVLGAAQHLSRTGARAAAAAVVGAMIGAELFSRILFSDQVPVPGPPPPDPAVALLTLLGLAGGALAVLATSTDRLPDAPEFPGDRRMLRLGVLASPIPLLPKLVFAFIPGDGGLLEAGVAAGVALAASFAVAAVAGLTVLGTMTLVTATALAGSAPIVAAYYSMTMSDTAILPMAAAGLLLGVAAATTRRRLFGAAGLCLAIALGTVLAAPLAGGSLRTMLFAYTAYLPAALLMIVVIIAVVLASGAVTPVLSDQGALPLALGPLFTGLALAGRELMYFAGTVTSDSTALGYLYGPHPVPLAAALMGVAGVLLLLLAVREHRQLARRLPA
ncbi:hypothetical protein JOF53_002182 [Crossiella equi]|uniref:MFS transporter n=1 Tax=Crossiella equi TaxID=130796 RepID=A0ABS5A9P8_9PSEU|nr:hypothetical protein [Crossiella equi]MBP2473310.1 hypothetical protein [Crossiella equi]